MAELAIEIIRTSMLWASRGEQHGVGWHWLQRSGTPRSCAKQPIMPIPAMGVYLGDFGGPHTHAIEQPHSLVRPLPTPPVPIEALSFAGSPQMAPRLLFHAVFDEAKAATRVSAHRAQLLRHSRYRRALVGSTQCFIPDVACATHQWTSWLNSKINGCLRHTPAPGWVPPLGGYGEVIRSFTIDHSDVANKLGPLANRCQEY
jgi:hypothetical protein